jgi:ABC-2 type transport system ATP-binding protein
LADSIAVIDSGKVIAEGTSDDLKMQIGGQRVELSLVRIDDIEKGKSLLAEISQGEVSVGNDGRTISAPVDNAPSALQQSLRVFAEENIELNDAGMRRPTLDDVFLELTGHKAEVEA